MRINRQELITKVQVMISEREARQAERLAEAYTAAGEAETNYVKDHSGHWSKFADRIRLRLRQGQAITADDVPEPLRDGRGWHESVRLFKPSTVRESDFVPRTEVLTRLLMVLESSPDEFVSTSALDRIGAPLKELMRP